MKALQRGARLALPLLLTVLVLAQPASAQDGGQQAGLVVVHGDGRVVTRCVAFDEPEISGYTLLERSGLSLVSSAGPLGQTVCSLNGEGCPATSCFCECMGTPCVYWVYYHRQPDGSWSYANIGAAQRSLSQGDVDAWVWGEATQRPPPVSFEAICQGAQPPAAQPTAAPTVAPTPTLEPATASPTPAPTVAAAPTGTPVPPATTTQTVTPAATDPPSTATAQTTATLQPTTTVATEVAATASPTATPPSAELDDPPDGGATPAGPTETPSAAASPGAGQPQLVTFVIVLGAVVVAFLLLSRRPGS